MPPVADIETAAPVAVDSAQVSEESRLDQAESDMIRRFEDAHRRPDGIKEVIEKMAEERTYIHTDANLPTTPGGVATNYLARYQWIHSSQIYAKDPTVAVRPKRKLGQMVPAMQQVLTDFGKTIEYIVQHCAVEGEMRAILDGMIQDADTSGIVFLKVNWIEDLGKDPIGTFRPGDLSGQVRRLQHLQQALADGEFQPTDARAVEMKDLAECIQKELEAEKWREMAYPQPQRPMVGPDGQPLMDQGSPLMEAIPYEEGQDPRRMRWDGVPTAPQISELPRYRGFVFDVFDAEDVCWDWRITRPEMLHRGDHMDTRVWMTPDKIAEEFDIPKEGRTDYLPEGRTTVSKDESGERPQSNPNLRNDTDTDERAGALAVWERQAADGYVYTWVQGGQKFLRKVKRDVVTSCRYNVFPLYFNRVSGRVLPLSNTTLGRPLQDEINTVRTHKRAAKRAAYNRYIAQEGLFSDEEKEKLERCPPEGVVFIRKAIDDIKAGLMTINGQFNQAVHDVSEEKQELSVAMNIPVSATGQTKGGSDSATEAAIANQTSDAMAGRHRSILENFLQRIYVYMSEVLIQALPEENAKAIAGPGAVWPMQDREALWNHLEVDIEAGSTGKPDMQKNLDALKQSVEIGNAMGIGQNPAQPIWDAVKGMRKLADINDWREDPADLLRMPALPPMPMQGGPNGAPGAGGPSPSGPPMPEPGPPPEMGANPGPQMANPNHMAGPTQSGMPQ